VRHLITKQYLRGVLKWPPAQLRSDFLIGNELC